MSVIPFPLVPRPYRIGDHIFYITDDDEIKNGWIKAIKDYNVANRPIANRPNDNRSNDNGNNNRPLVWNRFYHFTETSDLTSRPISIHYKYVERLPNGHFIHQKTLLNYYENVNGRVHPIYASKTTGNTGGTPNIIRNENGNTGGTGETSGGGRKRTRRHRSRRNRSRHSR